MSYGNELRCFEAERNRSLVQGNDQCFNARIEICALFVRFVDSPAEFLPGLPTSITATRIFDPAYFRHGSFGETSHKRQRVL